jgi:uncharacterized repeat protein (TIGR04138 family)
MQKLDLAEAVDLITSQDRRFDREAYFFLRDALEYTVKSRKRPREGEPSGHVTGQQLLEGIRLYALKQFGPMVITVFDYWNIQRCEDFGAMVYSLIKLEVFGKTATDSIEDFKSIFSFEEAFVAPFRPEIPVVKTRIRTSTQHSAKGLS